MSMMKKEKRCQVSFRLEESLYKSLFREAELLKIPASTLLRWMIDERYSGKTNPAGGVVKRNYN